MNTSKIYREIELYRYLILIIKFRDEYDLKVHYPVVMIPGIVSSGLESWGTSEKSRKNFRKRMWGTMSKIFLIKDTFVTQTLKA